MATVARAVRRAPAGVQMLALLIGLVLTPAAAVADARRSLSMAEAQLADCVGAVLALESLWRSELAGQPHAQAEAEAAANRADMLLRVAMSRHVAVGHVQPFHRRAAAALAAARVRFSIVAPMLPDPTAALRGLVRTSQADCAPYLPP